MRTVWLALGSNLGDREGYLRGAIEGLQRAGLLDTTRTVS